MVIYQRFSNSNVDLKSTCSVAIHLHRQKFTYSNEILSRGCSPESEDINKL